MIQPFNNRSQKAGDDIKKEITQGSKMEVAAGIFTIYGFKCLKSELKKIKRQKAISGSVFEINLKNELKGRAIARECRKWIEDKVKFKTNIGNKYIQPHITLDTSERKIVYMGINEFSSAGFGYETDNAIPNQIIKTDDFDTTKQYIQSFAEIWNDEKILEDISEDELANEKTGFEKIGYLEQAIRFSTGRCARYY